MFWKNVCSLCGKGKKGDSTTWVVDPNTGKMCLPTEAAMIINTFFSQISKKLADEIPDIETDRQNNNLNCTSHEHDLDSELRKGSLVY